MTGGQGDLLFLPISDLMSISGPLFQTPEEAARQAAEENVPYPGGSPPWPPGTRPGPQAIQALRDLGPTGYPGRGRCHSRPGLHDDQLYGPGVAAIFGPGTVIAREPRRRSCSN